MFTQCFDTACPGVTLLAEHNVHRNWAEGSDMSSIEPPPITVVQPGGGPQGNLGTIGVVFKLWDRHTGGALSIAEHPFPVAALLPPHLHTREDEYSIVTEGLIGFRSGDREVVLGPGGCTTHPRGGPRALWNARPEPAPVVVG